MSSFFWAESVQECCNLWMFFQDWDKLSKEFEGSSSVVIADVDCTAGGKSKCEEATFCWVFCCDDDLGNRQTFREFLMGIPYKKI